MPDWGALWVYLGTFGLLVAAGFGAPIPEELPIVLAGAAVGHVSEQTPGPPAALVTAFSAVPDATFPANIPWPLLISDRLEVPQPGPVPNTLRWWIMLPVCILGVVISDGLLYGMGRLGGRQLLERPWVRRWLPPEKRQGIEQNFHKYGIWVLLFARFLPAIRSPIFIMAGVLRLRFGLFVLADGLYAIPGVTLLFTLAFWFGDQFTSLVMRAEGKMERLRPLLILLALTVVASYLFYHFMRHPVATGDPREELPLVGGQIADKMGKQTMHALPENLFPTEDGDLHMKPPLRVEGKKSD